MDRRCAHLVGDALGKNVVRVEALDASKPATVVAAHLLHLHREGSVVRFDRDCEGVEIRGRYVTLHLDDGRHANRPALDTVAAGRHDAFGQGSRNVGHEGLLPFGRQLLGC